MKVRWIVIAGAVALAGCTGLGIVPAAAQASSASVPNWTRQAPATKPPARQDAAMAYDAATGTVVLFGGNRKYGGTWTWDGTTWTQQHPPAHPPTLVNPSMAYDAATGTVVLFGGFPLAKGTMFANTWTWDGTTWTEQHPATSPPGRANAVMAYDGSTGNVVLFGGCCNSSRNVLGDTWTWDGTTWTEQHPTASPPAREFASMAYDGSAGTMVLFGGDRNNFSTKALGDTWTWDGTTWIQQDPATHPTARANAVMAYDAATGNVVLSTGVNTGGTRIFGDTWTWDGTTWTRPHPANHPPARWAASMAYDGSTGTVVLFGGSKESGNRQDTWTWG